jgi:hypothetical protein
MLIPRVCHDGIGTRIFTLHTPLFWNCDLAMKEIVTQRSAHGPDRRPYLRSNPLLDTFLISLATKCSYQRQDSRFKPAEILQKSILSFPQSLVNSPISSPQSHQADLSAQSSSPHLPSPCSAPCHCSLHSSSSSHV